MLRRFSRPMELLMLYISVGSLVKIGDVYIGKIT